MVSITPGWTATQIRDFVYEYERQPYGTKKAWLAGRGVSDSQLRRWRNTVFGGDVDAGLVPREGSELASLVVRRQIMRREADRVAEIDALQTQVRELKEVNAALGKAIGLLHKLSEQEPVPSTMTAPGDSSTPRTSS